MQLEKLVEIRKELHKIPELSGKEERTSDYIAEKLSEFNASKIIRNIGGNGVAGIFDSGSPGPSTVLRAELDALPIPDRIDKDYRSQNPGAGHKCGHDGHMATLLGVASRLNGIDYNGSVILLFQPAEETAQGAKEVVIDEKFIALQPDYIFGYHNLPGFEKGSVIIKKGIFASASTGLICRLKGETSHAAHPENSRTPVQAMINIIQGLQSLPMLFAPFNKASLVTIIHAKLGEVAFGTTPGYAEVMATIRSHRNEEMEIMMEKAGNIIKYSADAYNLDYETQKVEVFPATGNDDDCLEIIENAARQLDYYIIKQDEPFPWSEDFAYYTQKYKGAFFGVGSGKNHPQLHNSDYDFPDEILEPSINMMINIIRTINK